MTSSEIETLRVEKLREINLLREDLNTVYDRKYELEKELVKIAESIRKAKHLLAVKKTEAEILQSEYWRAKQ